MIYNIVYIVYDIYRPSGLLNDTHTPAFSPAAKRQARLRERNRSASDPVFPAPWRHGEGRPQAQQRSYCHHSRPNRFRSIRETEYATRQCVRSRTTKPGNMKRRTESQKCRKFCGGNPQQESPLNQSSGGNSTAEIHSKNLCLSQSV